MTPYSLNFQSVVSNGMAVSSGNTSSTFNPPPDQQEEKRSSSLIQLSEAQSRLWYLCQLEGAGNSYNLIQEFDLKGTFEVTTLEMAVQMVITRQPALRTNFVMVKGQVFKQILTTADFKVSFENLSQLTAKTKQQKLQLISARFANYDFDLAKGPLLCVKVVWLGNDSYRLMINMHHIIADGWSFELFKKELATAYNGILNNNLSQLETLPILEQQSKTTFEEAEKQRNYWKQQFEGAPLLLELPNHKLRPPVQGFKGRRIYFDLPQQITEQFKLICKNADVSNYVGLLTAFKVLIGRYTNREDIIVGSPFSGRHKDKEKQAYIDFFVNTIPLRNQIDQEKHFVDLLSTIKSTVHEAFPNQGIQFDKLVESINPERNPSFSPVFQIMFVFQNYEKLPFELKNLQIWKANREVTNAKFDLTLEITEENNGQFTCAIDFNTAIYKADMIQRFVNHYQALIGRICQNPKETIKNYDILTEQEHKQIIYHWNDNALSYPKDKCLHQLFEEQVVKAPNAIALSFQNVDMTYETLNSKVNQLAHYLIQNDIQREDFVAIQINRSFEMIISVLAVLKAGGSYVAIDPEYPPERKTFMLLDANVKLLISTSDLLADNSHGAIKSLSVDGDWSNYIMHQSIVNPELPIVPKDLAYMIYTSGSTGQPKGVLIEHKGIPNLVYDHIRKYDLKQGNCILQFASLSFDASICEIGMALLSGATLCIAKKDQILPGPGLIRLLNNAKISHVTLPPSALSILPSVELPNLKVITVTGEACPEFLIDKWGKGRKFFNGYGPSEVTIGATISEFQKGSKKTSIGRPFANYHVYLLDNHLKPVPIGIPGEIFISGIGLARGYYNNKEATATRFIDCPFEKKGNKMYRTGDIGRYLPNGEIEFIGRNDNMVKLRGMRIELGEIETKINDHEAIEQCKVVLKSNNPSDQKLVGYYVTNKKQGIDTTQLKKYVSKTLPKHMVPTIFMEIDKFPKSPNGKIDFNTLPEIPKTMDLADNTMIAARNDMEEQLVAIWKNILQREKIGISDNFFDLGGHSLLAASMVAKIEDVFDVVIQVSSLLQYPTIEKLAGLIDDSKIEPCCAETIIPIRKEGHKTPLFIFHTPSGNVVSYHKLTENLPSDHPVFGVEVNGIAGNGKPYYSLKTLANFYADEIRKFMPVGEINLAGYCFGGLLAYEVAVALQEKAEPVGHVFLIGSKFPSHQVNEVVVGENETISHHQIPRNNKETKNTGLRSSLFYLRKNLNKKLWKSAFDYHKKRNLELPKYLLDFKLIHHQIVTSHNPSNYEGDVILIQPSEKSKSANENCKHLWQQLVVGQVNNLKTLGQQGQLLEAPYAISLGKIMSEIICEDAKS